MTELQPARRIASMSDQRRRRVERAIHDGVQQHLTLVGLKVSLLREEIRRDPAAAERLCAELSDSLRAAQREMRELAHWIYPAVLENAGLVAALTDLIGRQALRVEVRAPGVARHSRELETTVYFCCLEALDNVERHAEATRATVTVSERDGTLEFTVSDDGRGFDGATPTLSGGLQHVADRLAAVGGQLALESVPGHGATVRGRIPVDDAQAPSTARR